MVFSTSTANQNTGRKNARARFVSVVSASWRAIRPGAEARRGAAFAASGLILWVVAVAGLNLQSGFGFAVDLAFACIVAGLGVPLVALFVALLLTILRPLPRLLAGFFVGVFLLIAVLWFNTLGLAVAAVLLFVECSLGAAAATILLGGLRHASLSKKIVTYSIGALALAANVGIISFLRSGGIAEELLKSEQSPPVAPLNAPNPSLPGPFPVNTLFYGSGNDLRRPEYGPSVAIRTGTVNAAPFFKEFTGWKAFIRRRYWGFGMDRLPLNARVWYPGGAGPFPLVLIVHGNHRMSEFSDPGYAYLGQLLASRGFITVSIDENFLNVGLFHDPHAQQPVRGWMMLEHLKLWKQWNESPGNPFYRKIDLENIALAGHSRGGEAAATAALFNKLAYYPDDATIPFHYGFHIKSVIAIAPVDGQYKPAGGWRFLEDVNYLTLQGANDGDLSSFMGSRQWDHVRFSGGAPFFKAELYIYRANHGQFNTVWGRTDNEAPQSWFLNLRPLLPPAEQRQIAKVYISAFLEATLHNRREYLPLFNDPRFARAWLPQTLYINRYLDSSYHLLAGFNEDADVTTTTAPGGHIETQNLAVWREGRIPFREGNRDYNGVFIGWDNRSKPLASYAITLPPNQPRDWQLGLQSALMLSVAVTNEDPTPLDSDEDKPGPTDFTIALEGANGAIAKLPIAQFKILPPPFAVHFTKLERLDKTLYKESSEPVFQSIRLPLAAFSAQNPQFDPASLKSIRLIFDKTPSRVILVSSIGFSNLRE